MSADEARRLLETSRVIAVVGCSRDQSKVAHRIPAQLQQRGFEVIPVNPHTDELLGERCYPTLADVPGPIDLVDVFRPAPEAADVARQAVEVGASALWLQLGIRSEEARRTAEVGGLSYVEDRCTGADATMFGIRK